MLSPLDDYWHHPHFRSVGHPELVRIAGELGCGTFKVYHASGQIEFHVKHGNIKPQTWDLPEFRRLVAERIDVKPEKPQVMAVIDDDEVPF